jgi:hypothetical protein
VGEVIRIIAARISEAKGSPEEYTQINGKCNDISSADKNK